MDGRAPTLLCEGRLHFFHSLPPAKCQTQFAEDKLRPISVMTENGGWLAMGLRHLTEERADSLYPVTVGVLHLVTVGTLQIPWNLKGCGSVIEFLDIHLMRFQKFRALLVMRTDLVRARLSHYGAHWCLVIFVCDGSAHG